MLSAHKPGCGPSSRKVLILAGAYPPAPRVLKLLRYLPEHGWDPTLCVPRWIYGDHRFPKVQTVSGSRLWRFPFVPSPAALARRFMRSRAGSVAAPTPERRGALGGGARRLAAWESLSRRVLQWSATPDELVGWIPVAAAAGILGHWRRGFCLVLASGPPFSAVLAGLLLRRLTSMPLVVDLRDAWTLDPADCGGSLRGTFRAPPGRFRLELLRRLERRVALAADWMWFTSDYTAEAYRRAFPGLAARSSVLYNGAEESDFDTPPDRSCAFSFNYVGTIDEHQVAGVMLFVRSFARAVSQHPSLAEARVRVFGGRSAAIDHVLATVAAETGIASLVFLGPVLPHLQAAAFLKSRGVNLLFAGESCFTRLSKVSDCLAVGRPVLALAREASETARHLRLAMHRVYAGDSEDELAEIIVDLWKRHRTDAEDPGPFRFSSTHSLHWNQIAAEVAKTLDRVAERSSLAHSATDS